MSFKIGDKVKMTKKGFKFYSNLDISYSMYSKGGILERDSYIQSITELFSIHGVGTVVRFNSEGELYIRWNYSLDGVFYFHHGYYETKDVKKLNFLDKLIFKLKGTL